MTAKHWRNLSTAPRFRGIERRFVRTLLAGFGVVLVAMIASGVIGLRAAARIDHETNLLADRFLRETALIERLARQQSSLAVLLYSMAGGAHAGLEQLSRDFFNERKRTERVIDEALGQSWSEVELAAWRDVQKTAAPLFVEVNRLIEDKRTHSPDVPSLFHQLTTATARLMEVSYNDVALSRATQFQVDARRVQAARNLFLVAIALATFCSAACVGGSLIWFRRLENQAQVLAKLSLHTLSEQEENARRFSQEMHDEFGQALNAVGSTLSVVQAADAESRQRLDDAIVLVREAQATARDLSQLLRPRILDDFGLDAGLRELARNFSQRTGIVVDYRSSLRDRLPPMVETHLFRIAQEALTNTSRHTFASAINVTMERVHGRIELTIADNGGGFTEKAGGSTGLGLMGMRERAHAINGQVTVDSEFGSGVTVQVVVPCEARPLVTASALQTVGLNP